MKTSLNNFGCRRVCVSLCDFVWLSATSVISHVHYLAMSFHVRLVAAWICLLTIEAQHMLSCCYKKSLEMYMGSFVCIQSCSESNMDVQMSLAIPNPFYTKPLDIPNGFTWWWNSYSWRSHILFTKPLDVPNIFPGHRWVRYSKTQLQCDTA